MKDLDYTSNHDILQLLAKRMKEYRLAARLSQREFAEKSGVSYITICRFEQGKHPNISLGNFNHADSGSEPQNIWNCRNCFVASQPL